MDEIIYEDKGVVVTFKLPKGVELRLGGLVFTDSRWIVGRETLDGLKRENPRIRFVEKSK